MDALVLTKKGFHEGSIICFYYNQSPPLVAPWSGGVKERKFPREFGIEIKKIGSKGLSEVDSH